MLRLALYELITQLIIWLGRLRARVLPYAAYRIVRERTFDLYQVETAACCDCGLVHTLEYFGPDVACDHVAEGGTIVGHCWPIRPRGYRYRLRRGAGAPSLAKEKSATDGQP